MSLLKPTTWDLDFFLLRGGNDANTRRRRKGRIALALVYLSVLVAARFWLSQVTKHVPEPYLDEVFHIPQAQAYCRGDFHVWDPKLTTPPGLYVISTLVVKFAMAATCTVPELRTIDCLALIVLLFVSHSCRSLIRARTSIKHGEAKNEINWDAVHVAVNICLFPPVFFFSGLYYTDVVSTCIVIGAYHYFLTGEGSSSSTFKNFGIYAWGTAALFMRQTNIFWVAIFLGGLETVRALKGRRLGSQPEKARIVEYLSRGELFDPSLSEASVFDFLWCSISIAIAAICHPVFMVTRLWPYAALLASFGGFTLWNGGVVLGDKSNHVATIHLPQMLYIWPFFAFFSLPLLYPYVLTPAFSVLQLFVPKSEAVRNNERSQTRGHPYPALGMVLSFLASVVLATGIIHFNTIIHPFTLADNRHYVFYVFRYTIRRHRLAKYALGPVYIICSWLVFQCLSGLSNRTIVAPAKAKTFKPVRESAVNQRGRTGSDTLGATASFAIIWFLSTALSLITAPLVEPRYFIIPWVIWRLHVPVISQPVISTPSSRLSLAGWLKYWDYRCYDHRLWIETLWFLIINAVTGCVFLFKGFEWPQEPGKVQRFMW